MVLVTTFMTPPLLAWRIAGPPSPGPREDPPGFGGIDDLVSGAARERERERERERADSKEKNP
jgi:hypothetical protein